MADIILTLMIMISDNLHMWRETWKMAAVYRIKILAFHWQIFSVAEFHFSSIIQFWGKRKWQFCRVGVGVRNIFRSESQILKNRTSKSSFKTSYLNIKPSFAKSETKYTHNDHPDLIRGNFNGTTKNRCHSFEEKAWTDVRKNEAETSSFLNHDKMKLMEWDLKAWLIKDVILT